MAEVRMRDFSRTPRKLEFDADGDHFVCHPEVPPEVLQEMLDYVAGIDNDFSKISGFFTLAMPEESAKRIQLRMSAEGLANPITVVQALEIARWIIEEHSQRPFAQSATSSVGSQMDQTGIDLVDGVPLTE